MTAGAPAWRVEETCLNAWPGLRQVVHEGWLLRFSDGLSRRANSATPLAPDSRGGDALVAACERLYRRQCLPCIFRIPALIDDGLDRRLAKRGYEREGDTCTLYGDAGALGAMRDEEVRLLPRPTPRWLGEMAALQGHSGEQARTYRRIVGAIALPAAFAALSLGGEPAALAYGVLYEGLLCYESVITDRRHRRQGCARRVIGALAAWGLENGAAGACLQVAADNAPGRALYDSFGLKAELYRYHYRRAPGWTSEPGTADQAEGGIMPNS